MQEQSAETTATTAEGTTAEIKKTAPSMLERGVALIKSVAKRPEESHSAHASRLVSLMPDLLIDAARIEDRLMSARAYLTQVEDWCKRVSDGAYASVVEATGDDGKKKYSNEEKRQAALKEILDANAHWKSSQDAIKDVNAQIKQMGFDLDQYRRVREYVVICINFSASVAEVATGE